MRPHVLEIYVFDLPGTPALFIRTPNDKKILINGGSNSEIIRRLTKILPFYSKRLDMVITTEQNGKAVSGLIDVLNRYAVNKVDLFSETIGASVASTSDGVYKEFLKTVNNLKIETEEVYMGSKIILEKEILDMEVVADILFPAPPKEFKYSKASAPELVMRIKYGDTSLLFAGHSSPKIQKFIVGKAKDPSDVLIIFNNANDSNLARGFVASTSPRYLIYKAIKEPKKDKTNILAGVSLENRFNIHETGTLKIVSDGMSIKISKI